MAMSPNCVDTEQIPSKMVAGDREILGIGENPKSFGETRSKGGEMDSIPERVEVPWYR